MTGILLLVVVGFWIWASVQLTSLLLRRISSRMLRRVVAPAVFVALLVLPVLDEVIGRFQFRALCEDNAVLRINADEVKGKTVRLEIKPSNEVLLGQWLTTYHTRIGFRDTDSDREIGSYSSYVVKGGWFIRALGISETNAPLTLNSSCAPELGAYGVAKAYSFNIVN